MSSSVVLFMMNIEQLKDIVDDTWMTSASARHFIHSTARVDCSEVLRFYH